VLDFQLVKKDH